MAKRFGTALAMAAMTSGLLFAPGCGDGPLCPTEVLVFITSLEDGASLTSADDRDSDADGVQLDIRVRTSLRAGDTVGLTITGDDSEETVNGVVADDGSLTFQNVTLPGGTVTLSATGEVSGEDCGTGGESIEILVLGDSDCELQVAEGGEENENFNVPVLNANLDSDPGTPDFQALVEVQSLPGSEVELFLGTTDGEESLGRVTANASGVASFPLTLAQGNQSLRALCGTGLGLSASRSQSFFVDTIAPEQCFLQFPAPASFVTPADDADEDPGNGLQLTLEGFASAADDDLDPNSAEFGVGASTLAGSALVSGLSTAAADLGSPGELSMSFSVSDLAGNVCSAAGDITVVLDGCTIAHQEPAPDSIVTLDSSGDPGFQTNIVVQIDPACAGQPVVTTCGAGGNAAVPENGLTALEVTLSTQDQAEGNVNCRTEVTHPSGFVTFADASFRFDNLPPPTQLRVTQPPGISCGTGVTDAVDIDPGTEGVQIAVEVLSPFAAEREVIVNDGTPIPAGPGDSVTVTLVPGDNDIVGLGRDEAGNESLFPCPIELVDILVGFSPPIDDGIVGLPDDDDGDVTLGITLDLVGTVSAPNATVTVSIDGAPAIPATVPGDGSWTLPAQTLTPGNHTIFVVAQDSGEQGEALLDLLVDLTGGDPPAAFAATPDTRQSVLLTFNAPAGAVSYVGRVANEPINDGNFDAVGTALVMPVPAAEGTPQQALVEQLRAGTDLFFAIAAVDAAGNRSALAVAGPVQVDFDSSGAIANPVVELAGFGYQLTRGNFNGDAFFDIAVGAPFASVDGNPSAGQVHIFFGGADGIGTAPDVSIDGPAGFGFFGNGLTAVRWDDDAIDDLAVGAPLDNGVGGAVYIFFGANDFAPTILADADVVISSNPGNGGGDFFSVAAIGWSLARVNFDGEDSRDDLAIALPNAGGGQGGVLILYGGTSTSATIQLSETLTAGFNGARGHFVRNPTAIHNGRLFGFGLFNVGQTEVADSRDDLAISYYTDDNVTNVDEQIVVVRDRAAKPIAVGATELALELDPVTGNDLILFDDIADRTTGFGENVTSIEDQNGDGARDLIVSAYTHGGSPSGRVYIVDGALVGTVDLQGDPDALLTRFFALGGGPTRIGSTVLNQGEALAADIDNDGLEDLAFGAGTGANTSLLVWFGGSIPTGNVNVDTAQHVIPAPAAFENALLSGQKSALASIWVDVNNDGLEDICWADYGALSGAGALEVLYDE